MEQIRATKMMIFVVLAMLIGYGQAARNLFRIQGVPDSPSRFPGDFSPFGKIIINQNSNRSPYPIDMRGCNFNYFNMTNVRAIYVSADIYDHYYNLFVIKFTFLISKVSFHCRAYHKKSYFYFL